MDSHKTPSPIAVSETQSTNGVIWCECSMDPPADRSLCERTSLLSLSLSLGKVSIQLDCRCRHRRCQQQLQLLLLLLLLLCPARDSVKTLRLSETMRDTHASRNVSRFERRVNTTSFVCATEWSKAERERERGSEKKKRNEKNEERLIDKVYFHRRKNDGWTTDKWMNSPSPTTMTTSMLWHGHQYQL